MDDYEREAKFIGIRAAIAGAGAAGLWVYDPGWTWLLFVGMITYGLTSLVIYLSRLYQATAALEKAAKEREAEKVYTQEFIRTASGSLVRERADVVE